MVAVKAHFDGKVIVLDEPVDLPKGKPLLVQIDVVQQPKPPKPAKRPKRRRKGYQWQSLGWLARTPAPGRPAKPPKVCRQGGAPGGLVIGWAAHGYESSLAVLAARVRRGLQ